MNRTLAATALLSLASLCCLAAAQQPGCSSMLIINEIRIDQPGADLDEYFELRGAPGASLDGLAYIVIGDLPGAPPPLQNGAIESITLLNGRTLDENGLFLVAKGTFSLGTPNLIANDLNFENFDNVTHMLVRDFTGSLNQVLDTNHDGVLDVTPWSEVLCSVAIVGVLNPDGITADFFYSSVVVGPDNGTVPGHVWRCSNTLEWTIGPFEILDGVDTPGQMNPECEGGDGDVRINEIRTDEPGADINEYFELFGDAGTSLAGLTYIVLGDGTAAQGTGVIEFALPLDGFALDSNGYFVVAGPSFNLGVANYTIPDPPSGGFFENNDTVTHMLVRGFSGAIGDDLDPKNTCELAVTPWTEVIDSVSIVATQQFPPPAGIDCPYSTVRVGPNGAFVPGHVYRCDDKGGWAVGAFAIDAGSDTPGGPNPPCPKLGCGTPGTSPCGEAQPNPFCSDTACCGTVCKVDPACCAVAWDDQCVQAAINLCFGSGKAGVVFTYADTSPATLGSGHAATIRNSGIVGPTNGTNFFNIQGANNGNFANWGAVRWDLSEMYAFLDGEAAAGGYSEWIIDAVSLSLTQSLAGFSAAGGVSAFYAADDATPINPSVAANTLGGSGAAYAGQLGPVEPVANWTFTFVSGTGGTNAQVDTYPLSSADALADLNDRDDLFLTLVFTADDATSATYRGQNSPFTNSAGLSFNAPFLRVEYTLVKGGSCPGDINGDGVVNGADLGLLLQSWGPCPPKQACPADFNGDGFVNGADLGVLLQAWGACP